MRAATAKAQLARARDRASKKRATSAARAATLCRATASSDARAAAAERPCRSFAKLQASVATPRALELGRVLGDEGRRGREEAHTHTASSDAQAQRLLATSWPFQSTDGSDKAAAERLEGRGPLDFGGAERENNGRGVAAAQGLHDARAGVGAAFQGVARVSARGPS